MPRSHGLPRAARKRAYVSYVLISLKSSAGCLEVADSARLAEAGLNEINDLVAC